MRGSRLQVEGFIFLMMFYTSSDEISGKQFRDLERTEQMCVILEVSMKL